MIRKLKNTTQNLMFYCLLLLFPFSVYAKCDVVATVYNTDICQVDITYKHRNPAARPISTDQLHKIEINRLAYKIRAIAAENLLPEKNYTPNKAEIDSYHDFLNKSRLDEVRHSKEIISTIEELLKINQYAEQHRKRLEKALSIFRNSVKRSKNRAGDKKIRDDDMIKRFGKDALKELNRRIKQSRYRMSKQVVSRWKMNQALFKRYGGRVIFQQAGIEPIDAYREQLKDIRGKGALKILKPEYNDIFMNFERYLNMRHNYLSNKNNKYFNVPYWKTESLEENHRKSIEAYKTIPHL